jgi:hypothetical protein
MALDGLMAEFLSGEPTIEVRGNQLTLTNAAAVAEFVARGSDEAPSSTDEPSTSTPTTSTIPEATGCGFGGSDLSSIVGSSRPSLGPADPPLVPWASGSSAWHMTVADQTVEIRVPGTVVRDLVGERTEEVELEGRGTATIWFTDDWVQVQWFPTRDRRLCDSFDVTVAGPSEDANRDLAVALAGTIMPLPGR